MGLLDVSWDFILTSGPSQKNSFFLSLVSKSKILAPPSRLRPDPSHSGSQQVPPRRLKGKDGPECFCRGLTYSFTIWSLKDSILPTMSYPDVIPGQIDGRSHKLSSCATALGTICKLSMKVCSPVVLLGTHCQVSLSSPHSIHLFVIWLGWTNS